ncbi:MAG: hypothetical protein PUB32_03050 [Clostridiales bacterium]|nr:hypothetical protein [Clostridiales bacterium]
MDNIAAKTILGTVSIVPRGAYDSAAIYERLNAVEHSGDSWLALRSSTGVTPVEGEDWMLLARGGQIAVVNVAGAELTLTLGNNTETRCADPVAALTIEGFAVGDEGKAEQWGLVFTASADSITVAVPDTLIWAVAEPVFSPGSMYWISVVTLGDKYLAAWTEVLADESTTA